MAIEKKHKGLDLTHESQEYNLENKLTRKHEHQKFYQSADMQIIDW